MKMCSYCGKKYPDDAIVCAVDQNPLDEQVAEADSPAGTPHPAKPMTHCPACGALDGYKRVVELRGSFNLVVFLIGGLFAVFFRTAGRPRRVQCNKCGAIFDIHTPSTKVSRVIFWLLIAPALLAILILLLHLLAIFFGHG